MSSECLRGSLKKESTAVSELLVFIFSRKITGLKADNRPDCDLSRHNFENSNDHAPGSGLSNARRISGVRQIREAMTTFLCEKF